MRSAVTVEEERLRAAEKLEKRLQLASLTHKQREVVQTTASHTAL